MKKITIIKSFVLLIFFFSCGHKTDKSSMELLDILSDERFEQVCSITNLDTNYNSYKSALKIRRYTEYLLSKNRAINEEFKNSYNSLVDQYIDKTKLELCKLKSNEDKDIYQYKLTEYLILNSIVEQFNSSSFLFDNIGVQLTSNAAYNKGELNIGDEYLGHVFVIVRPDSMKVSLNEGYEEKNENYYYEIKKSCNKSGKVGIKGTITFPIGNEREISLDFTDNYVVNKR